MTTSRSVTIFTTFNASGYEEYGRHMLQSFVTHLPADATLLCFADGFTPDFRHPLIEYRDLNASSKELAAFKRKFGHFELAHGIIRKEDGSFTYNYNYDAIKFCHKVFCITHALKTINTRYAFWVDGDTICKSSLPDGFFQSFLPSGTYTCYLGRTHAHSECGFLGFDTTQSIHADFVSAYESLFNNGDIFQMRAWHDCVAYDELRNAFEELNLLKSNNISGHLVDVSHVFINTILGEYIDHLKGPSRKKKGESFVEDYVVPRQQQSKIAKNRTIHMADMPVGSTAGRYAQINPIIADIKPKTIVEIGTWNGYRALEMAKEALKHQKEVTYYGFDLFEHATDDTDAEEMNVKPHYTVELVTGFLENFKAENPGFDYQLTAGNTRETLKDMAVDFAFIDGGHSIETIRGDYEALKYSRFILFDDYYEGGIDIEKFGCNEIIRPLEHVVLPVGDPVSGGGITKFVLVQGLAA